MLLDGIGSFLKDNGHAILDTAGMVPVIGEGADIVKGIWYAFEGDYGNAALSFGAAISIAGNLATAGKWGKRAYDAR
ncbi:hypothetical protein IC619_013875 [Hazenella sp. IB182353]|nr:hypothetical protein [Polycladospora coralii]MBS7531572.1 hypothetical protein [Polycladospora coralii]